MPLAEPIPYEPPAQQALARRWETVVGSLTGPGALSRAGGVRRLVRASWQRSATALVRPDLPAAPMAYSADQLYAATEEADWLGAARDAMGPHRHAALGAGHILTLFDAEARMLDCDGDPAALEGLAQINFRPGGLWAEDVVGTNGPGTALSTGRATHIVGAEHFCERWHPWHCAAVPIRDPGTGRVAGVLDISGFRERAHPHTLQLALALAVAIEQTLAARATERRCLTLQAFADLTARYPGDAIVAIDRGGRVVARTPAVPPGLAEAVSAQLTAACPGLLPEADEPVCLGRHGAAHWFPVRQGRAIVGACLVLEGSAGPSGSEGIPFRPGEVAVYARRLFAAAARDLGRLELPVEPEVYYALQAYHWPGNLRELKHVIRRLALGPGPTVRVADLPLAIRAAYLELAPPGLGAALVARPSEIDREDARLMEVVNSSATMAAAAARLGITRSTLYRRMERFGLRPRRVVDRR